MLFEAFWQACARMILVGLNADEPKMPLAEGEKLQALPMVVGHRAKGSLHLRLEAVAVRASRLRTGPYLGRQR